MRRHTAIGPVTPLPRPKQQHRRQRNPAAQRLHHHRTCKIMKCAAKPARQTVLKAKIVVPDQAFKKRLHQPHQKQRGKGLGPMFGALGNAP